MAQVKPADAQWPKCSCSNAASAIFYPFQYAEDERTDLGALMFQQHADPTGRLRDWGQGSCRDFAVLFVEAASCLGFGTDRLRLSAWSRSGRDRFGRRRFDPRLAEIYVPGAGWITFDPTNRSFGGFNLIPITVARDIRQAMPVAGSFVGASDAFMGMEVEVEVTAPP